MAMVHQNKKTRPMSRRKMSGFSGVPVTIEKADMLCWSRDLDPMKKDTS